jgi:hypothetical protein
LKGNYLHLGVRQQKRLNTTAPENEGTSISDNPMGSGNGKAAGCYEHGKEPSGPCKTWEFLEQTNHYQRHKNDLAEWSQFSYILSLRFVFLAFPLVFFSSFLLYLWWLRPNATSRKVAGSRPDDVNDFFFQFT